MHVAQMGNWREVLTEQLALVRSSGLAARCDRIFLCVLGREEVVAEPPFELLYRSPNLLFFEYETLSKLRTHSRKREGLVWYIHTKGVSKTAEEWAKNGHFYREVLKVDSLENLQRHEREWRAYMQHFIVRRHVDCIKALETFDVVGASWRGKPCPHFSGNFWWARTSYLRTLGDPFDFSEMVDEFGDRRGGAECWLGSGSPSVKNLRHLGHNFYRWGLPAKDYLPIYL